MGASREVGAGTKCAPRISSRADETKAREIWKWSRRLLGSVPRHRHRRGRLPLEAPTLEPGGRVAVSYRPGVAHSANRSRLRPKMAAQMSRLRASTCDQLQQKQRQRRQDVGTIYFSRLSTISSLLLLLLLPLLLLPLDIRTADFGAGKQQVAIVCRHCSHLLLASRRQNRQLASYRRWATASRMADLAPCERLAGDGQSPRPNGLIGRRKLAAGRVDAIASFACDIMAPQLIDGTL